MSNFVTSLKDISLIDTDINIAFVVGEFNREYTKELEDINIAFLNDNGFENVVSFYVPGAFEIPGMTRKILESGEFDLIITLGVVIRGDTPHFDYVCNEASRGIMDLTMSYDVPIIFGLLTCNNEEQVKQRIKPVYALSGLNLLSELIEKGL
nr:6,7-dimethyl-8-ribityllumazine synthase [Candidatus Gracilibacteria bacterium]